MFFQFVLKSRFFKSPGHKSESKVPIIFRVRESKRDSGRNRERESPKSSREGVVGWFNGTR